jgi:hypothetical protein
VSALSAAERQRLAAILARLASPFDGEVTAAGLAAARFIRDRGLTWQDVIHPSAGLTANHNTIQPWRDIVADCLRQPGSLRPWERDFLRSLAGFVRISAKQRSVLGQIADRVLRRAAA